jgi:rhodanese-related sulfurtransferase
VKKISAKSLIEQINSNSAPLILDVRSKREFDLGHVPGARHVPFWQMSAKAETLFEFRERPIVVYCGHGPRAYIAGAALRRQGFKQVAHLAGHMKKWKSMRLPLAVATDRNLAAIGN